MMIRISPEMHRLLRWHYAETGEPMNRLVNRLIQEWSDKNARER